jgi:hypothetical protein
MLAPLHVSDRSIVYMRSACPTHVILIDFMTPIIILKGLNYDVHQESEVLAAVNMLVFFDADNGSSMFIRNVGSAYKSTWRINPKTIIIIIVVVISFTNFSQPLSLSIEG